MSKEAARVVKQVKANNLPNIVTRVKINNQTEFESCVTKIITGCPDTVVMIVADIPITKKQKDKVLLAASYVPDRVTDGELDQWLDKSVEHVVKDGELVEVLGDDRSYRSIQITYPEDSESTPFKLVDMINGPAFSILKKAGLQEDESSSEEDYGFEI